MAAPFMSDALYAAGASGCLYDCETSLCYDFGNTSDFCIDKRAECEYQCSQGGAWSNWGAIAYSPKDKGAGWSYGWNDEATAKKEALKNCSLHGTECEVWVWYSNGCGAIAIDGDITRWGQHSDRQSAEQRALQECSKAGGKNCVIQVSQCAK